MAIDLPSRYVDVPQRRKQEVPKGKILGEQYLGQLHILKRQ